MLTATWRLGAPEDLQTLDSLAHADYSDCFSVPGGVSAPITPAQYTHLAFRAAPGLVRSMVPIVQRFLLGLHTDRESSVERPLGWTIVAGGNDWIRLEARSWMMTAHLVGKLSRQRVDLATFVRFDHPVAHPIWRAVVPLHRLAGRAILHSAARRQVGVEPVVDLPAP